jgi:hypothetical protein
LTLPHKPTHILVLVILLAVLFPSDALAYLDPGTGSLFIQGAIATLAAAGYALRLYWSRIQLWFKRRPDAPESERPPVERV